MKIIFLDIDGVLNSAAFFNSFSGGEQALCAGPRELCLDPQAVRRLNTIIYMTRAELILSTSWRARGLDQCNRWLLAAGCCKPALDVTPFEIKSNRVADIQRWMQTCSHHVTAWIALDDADIQDLGTHAIQTSPDTGLLDSHVTEAIAQLGLSSAG